MNAKKLIGIFGGTFDPIHNGHLNVAETLYKNLPFTQIQFIPCGIPPHRTKPKASTADRLAMAKLATADFPGFVVNDLETKKTTPSYTIETLQTLQPTFADKIICLILSTDAFASLNTWHQWEKILNYCHIIVVNRIGHELPNTSWLEKILLQHQTKNPTDLTITPTGKILFQSADKIPISATHIRKQLAKGDITSIVPTIPPKVLEYIQQHHLYTGGLSVT
jgi:nicotinate-nucleotide adenylyltransferase